MRAQITGGFWRDRLEVNARRAIFHQWEQLEASGCIENFRIAAGESAGLRTGWFFADSDAYKWLDAASRILATHPNPELAERMDTLIALLWRAQDPDGYIFTYNQIHFPGARWVNLQIEHELYCHGHLIEAGVSHHEATDRSDLLEIAIRAADRIVADFRDRGPEYTPGHEEIEIALLRLYDATENRDYLEMARQFIEQRGRAHSYGFTVIKHILSMAVRQKQVQKAERKYLSNHPGFKPVQLPPYNVARKPWNMGIRSLTNALTGKIFQQHLPIREQTIPVGHSVRFGYLETATAMLARRTGDKSLIPTLERAWDHMVARRMYITGGIGSLPGLLEGFGNDYELDPEFAYTETCAALASLFWNWQMAGLTGEAKYSDLFEWQLYNAAAVGMGLDGMTYLFNNPLTCRGGVTRKPWYAVPCCPSNLSRTWADLGEYIYSAEKDEVRVHQYINSQLDTRLIQLADGSTAAVDIKMDTTLPFGGRARLKIRPYRVSRHPSTSDHDPIEFTLSLRVPGWGELKFQITGGESTGTMQVLETEAPPFVPRAGRCETAGQSAPLETAAGGYDPRFARWLSIRRKWTPGEILDLVFEFDILLRRASPRVRGHSGKIALSHGPILYCLESVDNPDVDIFSARIGDRFELGNQPIPQLGEEARAILGHTPEGKPLTFIPYHMWGNRGPSQMTVWFNE